MQVWVNSVIEGELRHSGCAQDKLACTGLENLVRLHRLAGRDVHPVYRNGEPAYEVRCMDGHVHAIHWLSRSDEGAPRLS